MDHHYLPKFYLKKWAATDGTVLRYYRLVLPTGDKIIEKRVGPRGAGFEPGLYAVAPGTDWESYDENIVETDVMSPIDDAAAVVLDKMLSDAPSLDSNDRTAWAMFLNSLIHRHRDPIQEADRMAPAVAREVRANLLAKYTDPKGRARVEKALAHVRAEEMGKTVYRSLMVQAIRDPGAAEAITGLDWEILGTQAEAPFITTDRPLLINFGRGGPIEVLSIPISPRRLFVAYRKESGFGDGAETLENLVLGQDLMLLHEQPCRFVFSSQKLTDDFRAGDHIVRLRTAVEAALRRQFE